MSWPLAYHITWTTYGSWLPGDPRGWKLHAVNARTNHVHCVIAAPTDPDTVAKQLKAWCSRRLNELRGKSREHWWTRDQSTKFINDDDYLRTAIHYVVEGQ